MTAVGSSKSEAGAACEVQLPPSPEPGAHSPNSQAVPEYLTLEAGSLHESNSRLRSIAGYGSFDPRVMACSHASRPTKGVAKCRDDSSLLALAGPNGVLLTRMSRPQVPLAILSHMSSSRNQKTPISSLAFQFPSSSESLLLAAARGSGVLVWDASGHSLSPLMGRLGSDASSAVIPGQQISSLDWMKGTNPLLATSTARTACIWDVRAAIGSASSRPSLRFGSSSIPPSTESSIIQVACSRGAECATLDRSGVLRVYDIRMAGRPRSRHDNVGELSSFSAFGHIGAGLAYFSTANGRNRWVTWGLDDLRSPALVKIWSRTQTPADSKHEPDDESYWYMDGSSERSPTRPPLPNNAQKTREQYHQVAQFSTPGLACARVCPTPFGDCLVSVGVPSVARGGDLSGFDADLWKVNPDGEEECNDVTGLRVDTYGVVKIASFSGGLSNDKRLASSIGSHVKMGSLRCAELAVESTLVVSEKDSGKEDTISRNTELQLCCLSEDGFVTSYVVSSQASRMGASSASKPFSPPRRPSQRNASDETVAIFDGNQESASQDAAMAWRAWTSPSSPFLKPREIEDDPVAVKPELSPFQLDVQHAPYGAPSSEEPESLGMNIQSVAPLVSGKDGVDVGLAQMPSRTGIIDKKTVPSPRICGASFSAGMEGIVCFQNGEVRKLWAWYQKTDPQRRAHTSQTQREVPPLHATRQGGGTDHEIAYLFAGDSGVADSQETVNHHCPRTMHDLDSMTNAANDAQWKESADAIGTSDVESEDSTEILDGSTHGSSTGSDDTDEQDKSPQKGEPGEETTMDGLGPIVNMSTFVGPSADMLVPAVKVVHEHDALIFNRQSCELAEGWLLGEWQSEESERRSVESVIDASSESFRQAPSRSGSSSFAYSSGSVNAVAHLASRQSDPMLAHLTPRSPGGRKSYGVSKGDDAPVRGGEYSVRPNRQESMVFLRKLFQQQEARTLLSPPDEPLLPKKVSPPRRIASSASALQASSPTTVALDEIGAKRLDSLVGVKTITPLPGARQKREIDRRRKLNTKNICLHNSDVCVKAGQPDKANTWSLLAQLVDNVLQHDGDDFNGWNGGSRGALGRDLVENFFDYYERQGDVQMLSTMVCVLSEGQRKATAEQLSPSLLPSNSHEKHDRIIRCYADILFSWRLLTTRAELNKHLIHPLPEATREGGIDHATFDIDSGETQAPGVAIVAVCPSCNQATSPGSLLCSKCATFAFRCVMCANAVRGLFTVCWSCGHGGHTNHMLAWFKNHTTCPSGCGCTCVLSTLKDDEIK